jgi:hypothetical protein
MTMTQAAKNIILMEVKQVLKYCSINLLGTILLVSWGEKGYFKTLMGC